ncbi:hypothetical protein B0H13DRAFT_2351319 [Mycena leptocephala]|nr:hypothetical protein B0H13DRAFT_2351319 [Mycena leptocephala]
MEMEEDGHDAVVFWLIFTPKRRRTSGLRVLANVTHLRIDFTLLAVLGCPRTCHAPIGRLYDRAALPHPPVPLLATITPTPAAPPIHLGSLPPRLDCISTTPTNSTSVLAHLALSRLLSSSPFILRIPLPSLSLSSGARSSSGLHGCTAITRQLHPPHSAPVLVLQPLATRLTSALLAPRDSQYGNTAIGLAPKASGAVYSSLSSRHATTIRLFVDVAGAVVDLACHVITLEPHLSSLPTSHSLPLALRTMPAFLTAPRLPR